MFVIYWICSKNLPFDYWTLFKRGSLNILQRDEQRSHYRANNPTGRSHQACYCRRYKTWESTRHQSNISGTWLRATTWQISTEWTGQSREAHGESNGLEHKIHPLPISTRVQGQFATVAKASHWWGLWSWFRFGLSDTCETFCCWRCRV